jgi:hypothetical protein
VNLIHLDNSVALLTVLMNKDSPGNPAGEEQDGSTEALLLVTFPEIEEAMGVPEIKDNLTSHILSRDANSKVEIEGLDSDAPTCSIGGYNFVGSYEHLLGSQMFFEVDDPKEDKRKVRANGLGKRKLVFKLKNHVGKKRKTEDEEVEEEEEVEEVEEEEEEKEEKEEKEEEKEEEEEE